MTSITVRIGPGEYHINKRTRGTKIHELNKEQLPLGVPDLGREYSGTNQIVLYTIRFKDILNFDESIQDRIYGKTGDMISILYDYPSLEHVFIHIDPEMLDFWKEMQELLLQQYPNTEPNFYGSGESLQLAFFMWVQWWGNYFLQFDATPSIEILYED